MVYKVTLFHDGIVQKTPRKYDIDFDSAITHGNTNIG